MHVTREFPTVSQRTVLMVTTNDNTTQLYIFMYKYYLMCVILSVNKERKLFVLRFLFSLLAFVDICLFIIREWAPLSNGLLWFLGIDFKVTGHLIGLVSLGVTTHKS